MSIDTKHRFSNRVADYVKYRPSYPPQVVDLFKREMDLTAESAVADVGSGTGISAEMFLKQGCQVWCVEPNAAMRAAAESQLLNYGGFHSINGSAEETTLAGQSIDVIVCAQAFHWFDRDRAKAEFRRIAKDDGWCALIWNTRKTSGSRFAEEYESLLHRLGTDYGRVNHENIATAEIAAFFGGEPQVARFANVQRFDLAGLRGRAFSSSYVPLPGQGGYDQFSNALNDLFARCAVNGLVTMEYETEIFYARIRSSHAQ